MNQITRLAIVGLALFCLAGSVVPVAHSTPVATATQLGTKKSERIDGVVTAIDTTQGTITVHDKKLKQDFIASLSRTTRFEQSVNVGLSGLAVGYRVAAHSHDDVALGATAINADRITVLSPIAEARHHVGKRSVEGIITSLKPLSISNDDGTAVTINTDSNTHVLATKPAALTDIAIGAHVQVQAKSVSGALMAKLVTILPSHSKSAASSNFN